MSAAASISCGCSTASPPCPTRDAHVRGSHPRQPRSARREPCSSRCAGAKSHGLEHSPPRPRRAARARCCGSPRPGCEPPCFAAAGCSPRRLPDLRRLVGRIADRFFGWPSSQLRIVGITGTNGKTTCAYLLAQCLERARTSDAAYMGTLGWGRIGALEAPTHTTPDAVSVHRTLAQLKAQGVREVAMEVSSHALDQGRVDGVRFHSAAFTNLTPRPSGLSRLDAGLRRGQGAPVRASHDLRARSSSTSATPSAASSRSASPAARR